ncbi:MAG: hypothetical protein RLW61_07470 [Gammaproteobacteria bacterium]
MALEHAQFANPELYVLYLQGALVGQLAIPVSEQRRCVRLLDMLEAATRPNDLDLPGNDYRVRQGHYRVTVVNGSSLTWRWRTGRPMDIDYQRG